MKRLFFATTLAVALGALAVGCTSQADPKQSEKAAGTASTPHTHEDGTAHSHGESSAVGATGHDEGHASEAKKGETIDLLVSSRPPALEVGKEATLKLMLHAADGSMLKEFEVTHEKLAHLIVVREGLDTFAHLHPEVDARGNMTATYVFPQAGKYRLFVDYKPRGKGAETAKAAVSVGGDRVEAPALVPDAPGLVSGDGLSAEVSLKGEGKQAVVAFDLRDEAGAVEDLEPYLGALGHLVVIGADGNEYVHSHPLPSEGRGPVVRFEAHFPGAGIYKGWGQFKRGEKVFVVPFVVEIQ